MTELHQHPRKNLDRLVSTPRKTSDYTTPPMYWQLLICLAKIFLWQFRAGSRVVRDPILCRAIYFFVMEQKNWLQMMLNVAPDCIWGYLNIQKFLKGEGDIPSARPLPQASDQALQLAPSNQNSWQRQWTLMPYSGGLAARNFVDFTLSVRFDF